MSLSITFNYLLFLAILIGSLLLPIHVGSFRFDSHVIYGFFFDRLLISNLFRVFLDYFINFLTLIICNYFIFSFCLVYHLNRLSNFGSNTLFLLLGYHRIFWLGYQGLQSLI